MSTADDEISPRAIHPERRLQLAELRPCRDHQGPDWAGHTEFYTESAGSGNGHSQCLEPPDVELIREAVSPAGTPGLAETIAVLRYGLAHAAWETTPGLARTVTARRVAVGKAYGYGKALEVVLRKLGKGQEIPALDWRQVPGELPLPQGAEKAAREFLGPVVADAILGQETP